MATKHAKKRLPLTTFSLRGRFFVIFGSRPGPKMSPKVQKRQMMVSTFRSPKRALVPEACLETFWDRSGRLRGDILDDFFSRKYVAKTTAKILSDALGEPTSARKPMLEDCATKIKNKLRGETLGKLFAGLAISGCGGLALAF